MTRDDLEILLDASWVVWCLPRNVGTGSFSDQTGTYARYERADYDRAALAVRLFLDASDNDPNALREWLAGERP